MFFKDEADEFGKKIYDELSDSISLKPGFNVGLTAEYPVSKQFSFETNLLFLTKGYIFSYKGVDNDGLKLEFMDEVSLYYIDMPINAKAIFELGKPKIYCALGPYIGMGIVGKYNVEVTLMGETANDNKKIVWGTAEECYFKRLDYGLNASIGVELSSFQLGVSYSLGLANIAPDFKVFKK